MKDINTIRLSRLLPHIFAPGLDLPSDVWEQEVVLERNKRYLVEAHSGTGKSSLCSYIYGWRTDYSGQLYFDDREAATLSRKQWTSLRRRHISLMWQELRLFPELTAWENVQIKNRLTHHRKASTIEAWFDRLGISDKRDTPVSRLSFGQQQRVAFLRSLCQPFDFILLDEPVSHLDESNAQLLAELLDEECRHTEAGILTTSIGRPLPLNYDRVLHL